MGKHKQSASVSLLADDTSWLDGDISKQTSVEKTIKILSLRPGKVQLQDGQWLEQYQTADVDKTTADWLLKSFPDYMKIA